MCSNVRITKKIYAVVKFLLFGFNSNFTYIASCVAGKYSIIGYNDSS